MDNDLDAMLQGDDKSATSQVGTEGQDTDSDQSKTSEQQSPEEVEFNRLPGSTQDRIKSFVGRLREKDAEIERYKTQTPGFVPPAPGTLDPDSYAALQTLSNAGVATDEKVDKKIGEALSSMRYEYEISRLGGKYTGSNSEPQFVREEYEDYVKSHPQYGNYLPEDVFKDHMFRNEFLGIERQTGAQAATGRSTTLKPSGTNRTSTAPLTPESIEETLNSLPSQEAKFKWMDEHRDEMDKALATMQQPS